jgi:hypothetical protein
MRERQELGPIRNGADYMMALARIGDLLERDDLESVGEMETLANFVESYEEKLETLSD